VSLPTSLSSEAVLSPGRARHDICAEHFAVPQGRIAFLVAGEEQTLGLGAADRSAGIMAPLVERR
jgi:hypothetical protein